MRECGLIDAVCSDDYVFYDRDKAATVEERHEIALKAFTSDWFLGSVNAMSEDGVFINIDGNVFGYGEELAGILPSVNEELEAAGNPKRYRNLLGITLGTGFGAGVVIDNCLLTGDNGCGGDVWIMRNKKYTDLIAEESVSTRAVRRMYGELSGETIENLMPKDIYDIAEGTRTGNREEALKSFDE